MKAALIALAIGSVAGTFLGEGDIRSSLATVVGAMTMLAASLVRERLR